MSNQAKWPCYSCYLTQKADKMDTTEINNNFVKAKAMKNF